MNLKGQTTLRRQVQINGLKAIAIGILLISTFEPTPGQFPGEIYGNPGQLPREVRRMFDWARQMAAQAESPIPEAFWSGRLQWFNTSLAGGWGFSNDRYQVVAGEQNGRWFSWQLRNYRCGGKRVANRSATEMEARIHATYVRLGLRLGREYDVEKRFPSSPKDPSGLTIRMRNRSIATHTHSSMQATYDLRCDCIAMFQAYLPDDRRPPQAQPRRQDPP